MVFCINLTMQCETSRYIIRTRSFHPSCQNPVYNPFHKKYLHPDAPTTTITQATIYIQRTGTPINQSPNINPVPIINNYENKSVYALSTLPTFLTSSMPLEVLTSADGVPSDLFSGFSCNYAFRNLGVLIG